MNMMKRSICGHGQVLGAVGAAHCLGDADADPFLLTDAGVAHCLGDADADVFLLTDAGVR